MKFRYYITDLFEGAVRGTNELSVAKNFAESSDFFVVDCEEGKWLATEGESVDVVEAE